MPLSTSAAPPRSGPARTWPLGSIRWRRGFAVKAFGGGTEARGPEESELQAAMMHVAAAVPSTVDRRQGFTRVLRERCAPEGATQMPRRWRSSRAGSAEGCGLSAAVGADEQRHQPPAVMVT